MKTRVILLAAGKGLRMRSRLPKLLHPLGGRPMIMHAVEAAMGIGESLPLVVVGHAAEEIRLAIGPGAEFVEQPEQMGTGHAVLQARSRCENDAD